MIDRIWVKKYILKILGKEYKNPRFGNPRNILKHEQLENFGMLIYINLYFSVVRMSYEKPNQIEHHDSYILTNLSLIIALRVIKSWL